MPKIYCQQSEAQTFELKHKIHYILASRAQNDNRKFFLQIIHVSRIFLRFHNKNYSRSTNPIDANT